MKPNQRNRFNNRHNGSNRNPRSQIIYRNTALESSGPCGKLRGTALQLYEKYSSAGKDALIQNDDILAETCFQYADHYMHIQNQAIANEQALHAQQQAQRAAIQEQHEIEPEADTVETEGEAFPSDGELKVTDLSIPVEAMNKNAEAPQTETTSDPQKVRRKLRMPRPEKTESEPQK